MARIIRQGDTPFVVGNQQKDYKQLYYSNPEAALKVPVTLQSGYGLVEQGTALSRNLSAGSAGGRHQLLPYCPTTFDGTEKHAGRAYLVADGAALGNVVYVTQDDSYKFKVGDDLIINDNTTAAENLGVISVIDRTSELHRAQITFATAIGAVAYVTTSQAYVMVEAGVGANNYSDCVGILEKSVNTGIGEDAAGALATLILGNVVLYEGLLTGFDAAAMVDLATATSFGQYVYIR